MAARFEVGTLSVFLLSKISSFVGYRQSIKKIARRISDRPIPMKYDLIPFSGKVLPMVSEAGFDIPTVFGAGRRCRSKWPI